jgi:uncharacterized repeat protein (TIGR03847 family)
MEINLNPCTRLTADAIGKPGKRVFYIHGETPNQQITVIIEKIQLQSLATGILKFLEDIKKQHPDLIDPSGKFEERKMHIEPPVDPVFRAGEIGLSYDLELDLTVMVVNEIIMDANTTEDTDSEINTVRYWCSREQLKSLALWGLEVVQQGRPICPLCGEPINPDGHFCPKKNGHNKH